MLLASIPVLNILFYKKLTDAVIEMEEQNNYRATSMPLALLCAVIPGLANLYLQSKINNHWKLHALSVMSKDEK